LKALDLVLSFGGNKKLEIDDFNKNISIDSIINKPPRVKISVTFKESKNETEFSDDLVTASTWLTKLDSPYSAKLTYLCYLPQKDHDEYRKEMQLIESDDIENYWLAIKHQFLRKYSSKIYSGNPDYKNVVDTDTSKKIDFQFLDAIRDVNRDLFTGKNTLLREVIDFFIDYDIKSNKEIEKKEQQKQIAKKRKDFSVEAKSLISRLQDRMESGKNEMLSYANETGASFENSRPDFEGHILDTELYSALKLIVKLETGIVIPASHNGLGYNNLIYISLLLAKMQKDASGDYLGSNSKTFPILAIEEPEAHLHPAMQYKLLKFLYENNKEKAKQIFITTHSPSITAAVELDNIICLNREAKGELNIAYLGRVFSDSDEDKKSKAYVQRFLDATKSDMLFSKKIILVEGITEQLLLPILAEYNTYSLESEHISVVNIGGRYFSHFLKLFDSNRKYSITKKVAVITDVDPVRKKKEENSRFKKCFPFELNVDVIGFEYKECSNTLILNPIHSDNIKVFNGQIGKSKTFEYDLILSNPSCKILVAKCMDNASSIRVLMNFFKEKKTNVELLEFIKVKNLKETINEVYKELWTIDEIKKNIIAAYYTSNINSKGEAALEIAENLKLNLADNEAKFTLPTHITEAFKWICE
jgi:predicted ATP-dependent endonuclease of OLD family